MDQIDTKRLVAESGKLLLKEKLAARTWGNVSCRTGDNAMVITPSGLGYDGMEPDDIVTVSLATGEWEGTRKPSSEKGIHISAYRAFPEAGFVIHTHQTYATAIGLAGLTSSFLTEEEKEALGGVILAEYGISTTKKLARNVSGAFDSGAHVVLMAHHGAVIIGKDRQEAFDRALLLEDICRRCCKGQPKVAPVFDEALADRLTALVKEESGYAGYISAAAVLACASEGKAIPAQLDDMAQMIGFRLSAVKSDETAVINALRKKAAVLVPGVGALCRASNEEDLSALCLLIEKACICWRHTRASQVNIRLSALDIALMRAVYLMKYSKKMRK